MAKAFIRNPSFSITDNRYVPRWAELFWSVHQEVGGPWDRVCPPFAEADVHSILADKYWYDIGPGGMADLFLASKNEPDPIASWVRAVKDLWAQKHGTTSTNLKARKGATNG